MNIEFSLQEIAQIQRREIFFLKVKGESIEYHYPG